MPWTEFADFAIKAGIPTATGVAIVYWLLYHHLPAVLSAFERTSAAQRADFHEALKTQSESVERFAGVLSKQIEDGAKEDRDHRELVAARTQAAISDLSAQTRGLRDSVVQLHARLGDPHPLALVRDPRDHRDPREHRYGDLLGPDEPPESRPAAGGRR